MIELNAKEYCQDCLSFEPDVEPPQKMYACDGSMMQTNTIIRCKYYRRCESIKRYLEKANTSGECLGFGVRRFSADICNLFEDLLDKHGIYIPDEYRTGDESEACLFGGTYAELEDAVTEVLKGMFEELKEYPNVRLEYDKY